MHANLPVSYYVVSIAFTVLLLSGVAYGSTNFDTVRFIQYLDEGTALEEVRKGNIDMYFWRIPSERLAEPDEREGLKVYASSGNSYSLLVNPAVTDTFNPFSIQEIRFALNYMVDRSLIVNELMSGYGSIMMSYYGPFDPEYISIIEDIESYNFGYNPVLANAIIHEAMTDAGATKDNGIWMVNNSAVEIKAVIRSDDPTRKSIGEILSLELERVGFIVHKDYGDLNKAFVVVYGADPADLGWHLYTEGWGRSGFVRYDSTGLAQMYSPWFSLMPGYNDPTFWNYENPRLDNLTQAIYTGSFASAEERVELIRQAVSIGVNESVRIFLAGRTDQYVVHESIEGAINDFGAGVPTRFTPINARSDKDTLDIGVKQIYQGSWNPVGGLSDIYSRHIWNTVWDPAIFRHPYSGEAMPIGATWEVETAGPHGALDVPPDAILWDVPTQSWMDVGEGVNATSHVTLHYTFGNWHHGIPVGMEDVLYSAYFLTEWGTQEGEDDRTFDPDYTPRASQALDSIKGIRVIDDDTLEVYVDYWHFDEGEMADWAVLGLPMPWEIYHAMEQAVIDGKTAFSRSAATAKEVSWLSVLIPDDAAILLEYLEEFHENDVVPTAISNMDSYTERYDAAISWIKEHNHAVISNGPYMVQGYSPEARTITIQQFGSDEYPFAADQWSDLEDVSTPRITDVSIPKTVSVNSPMEVKVDTIHATNLKYFVTDSTGSVVASGDVTPRMGGNTILVDTTSLADGAASFKIFALSDTVLMPDSYSDGFFVTDNELPTSEGAVAQATPRNSAAWWVAIPIVAILIGAGISYRYVTSRRRS
ncbi:MAG: ABC transporter substrate-binding protein [Cenarchaeum sp. SB0665_bin_23]|nr:ABC transporter substrate-binding protein [Cenarchaeum sp. SB0667_bin_13]MXY61137.1 ABC transporter substrate-binding protein [Cenarchaeum sp. SB0665_bin_23]MXZ93933.1 ABC transporter substrate-binding protein [Cenarchaeum sp. SB0666_bin_15]MYB46908.1 ABC transporter substrate-binding protein [Cenarchaeum sp. SB0662_bin_33]MYC79367.1 ABC transporter substrate-binding protein [Cenarchaeum sp. SB0661_bin_35]MYG33009.1 ABC transporter substrate-binding protein [Cenarchaeum sp. SB0677_bin_16]M